MIHREGFFTGAANASIHYQTWLPEGAPKAVLLVVHGLGEHSGRYGNVVDHFVPRGYAVYGMDHPGHGKSEGTRVYVRRFDDFLGPLESCSEMVRQAHPGLPLFLVGHSMGGLVAAVYLLDHQEQFRGAILSGASIKMPDYVTGALVLAGKVLSALVPKAGMIALDSSGVSRDPAVVKAYVEDPLVYTGKVTARLGAELLKAMERIQGGAGRIRLPLLILQGGADRMANPDGSRLLHELAGSTDKTLKVYDGLYHEVYNEPEHPQVLRDVESWIESRR